MTTTIQNMHGAALASGEGSIKSVCESNKAKLCGANLLKAHLYGADLSGANLSDTNLIGAELSKADLTGANLRGADLSRANLNGANLSRADLRGVNLCGANLSKADLSGAKYKDSTLLRYLCIGPIGDDHLQVFITDTSVMLRAGYWTGTLDDLATLTDREDYQALIPFISKMVEIERRAK